MLISKVNLSKHVNFTVFRKALEIELILIAANLASWWYNLPTLLHNKGSGVLKFGRIFAF